MSRPVALVVGGARRLGRRLVLELADTGHDVVVHYRGSARDAEDTAAEARRRGAGARTAQADLLDPSSIEALLASVAAREGRLDVLVFNVGNYDPKPPEQVTPDEWNRHMQTNLNAAWACCFHGRALLEASGGQLITLGYAGVDALVGNPRAAVYQVSKTGLLVLTKSQAEAWAPTIRANMISPGQLANSIDLPDDLAAAIPAGRAGTLDDIAGALRYLLGATYVTGANIDVAGGYRLSLR
jgi:3-oxoacyl-[acyl-carrier protein] reductase